MTASSKYKVALGALAVVVAAGLVGWVIQLSSGLGVTGMSNGTSWGLYIACFMFFVGLSAGGLIVASSASVFHIQKYKVVALPAVILSTCCICVAGILILVDLGGIQRFLNILVHPNFMSPLLWDVLVITLYLVINIIDLVFMTKGNDRGVEVLSRVALPVAILVHSVTAWIFGLQIAKAGWYSAILAPIFVASAMDSGLALLIIVLVALNAAKVMEVSKELVASLSGLLAVCIAVDAFFIGCEILTMAYPQGADLAILSQMFTGATAPFFWFEVLVGLAVPFCILVFSKNRQSTALVVGASVCVVLGVLCKRIWLLFTSFITPNVYGGLGIASGSTASRMSEGYGIWTTTSSYAVQPLEVLIVAGVICLGAAAFMLMAKRLIK